MKVYACPPDVPAPEVDYSNYDRAKVERDEEAHTAQLKTWLQMRGYDGPNTGRIFSSPIADGYASYLFADGKGARESILVHLPYGDAYMDRNASFLPEEEVLARIEADDRMREVFRQMAAERAEAEAEQSGESLEP